ncbi:MAG: chemotaxis response regulator protein-glutamate methylesterase [Bacteroidota bacterium]|nr:chemotaxis response regulator protein-glutamate methylesterase [Bacteroidota bacterium]
MSKKIKVLLVDDSGFMRMVISDIVNGESDITIIDTAVNGKEAVEKNDTTNPDVVLMDLTMKDYDGLYAIRHIMKQKPVPIVVLSSIRSTNPQAMVEAMQAGALDFIDKPTGIISSNIRDINYLICSKIREAAKIDISKFSIADRKNYSEHTFEDIRYDIVAIGASTGGTGAIESILTNLPSNMPVPIVIAQHMPAEFIPSFAKRLNELIEIRVKVAEENEYVLPNVVYILPGNTNTQIFRSPSAKKPKFIFTDSKYNEFNNPSVDGLMLSVAEVYGSKSIGVILTGMGKDGSIGLQKIKNKGGYTLAQNEATSVVWGMPQAAYQLGVVDQLVALKDIAGFLVGCIS